MLGRGTSKFGQLVQQDCYCSSLLWVQKHRGKKWRAKIWAHDEQAQQNKVDRYEKRLKRRAGNRELRTLLYTNGNEFPSLLQFEERVKRATKGKVLPSMGPSAARPKETSSEASAGEAASSSTGTDASHYASSWNEAQSHWNSAAANQMHVRHHARVSAQWARLHRRAFRQEFQTNDSSSADRSSRGSFWASFEASWSQRHPSGGSAGHFSDQGTHRHAHAGYQRSVETDSAAASHLNMLGLSSTSGIDTGSLRKAFLKCAMQWHPDRHTGSECSKMHAEEKFKQIQISYAFLQSYLAI